MAHKGSCREVPFPLLCALFAGHSACMRLKRCLWWLRCHQLYGGVRLGSEKVPHLHPRALDSQHCGPRSPGISVGPDTCVCYVLPTQSREGHCHAKEGGLAIVARALCRQGQAGPVWLVVPLTGGGKDTHVHTHVCAFIKVQCSHRPNPVTGAL